MLFFKSIPKKTFKLVIIALVALALILTLAFSWFGTIELTQLNTRSLTDWRLGGSISFIRSADDAKHYDEDGYEWFTDERGEGIMQAETDTRYYLGKHPDSGLGGYGVIGSPRQRSIIPYSASASAMMSSTQRPSCSTPSTRWSAAASTPAA